MQETRLIQLGGHRGPVRGYALVDAADYEWLSQWRWSISSAGYARRGVHYYEDGRVRHRQILMHRLILGLEDGNRLQSDHISGDTLDNRRANLRAVTQQQNLQNQRPRCDKRTSAERGVHYSTYHGRWVASVHVDGRRIQRQCATEGEAIAKARALRAEYLPYSVVA